MTPVTAPINPDASAASAARQPLFSLATAEKMAQKIQATAEHSNHPHHGRSEGLKGMAGIVASGKPCRITALVTQTATTSRDTIT